MRLIDTDEILGIRKCNWENRWDIPREAIEEEPTIDAVLVVRCKDCKWADWYKTADGKQFCYCIETGNGGRTADDYCSYGERREP